MKHQDFVVSNKCFLSYIYCFFVDINYSIIFTDTDCQYFVSIMTIISFENVKSYSYILLYHSYLMVGGGGSHFVQYILYKGPLQIYEEEKYGWTDIWMDRS